MDVRNCRKCGRIFNYVVGQPICQICRDKLEEQFKQVKDYIHDNKNCSVAEVVRECGVDKNQIQQWIREERLQFSSGIGAYCEKCGASISTGRFCEKCKLEMATSFSEASGGARPQQSAKKEEKKEGIKMHYLDR